MRIRMHSIEPIQHPIVSWPVRPLPTVNATRSTFAQRLLSLAIAHRCNGPPVLFAAFRAPNMGLP